ncbi:MAG: hypothetical protein J7K33_12680 [Candidatus Marinimicrobia bacterium]|nr:hypothetical protein [Candidatus Neomarinimicrobiota bacterium]
MNDKKAGTKEKSTTIIFTLVFIILVNCTEILLLHTLNSYSYFSAHFGSSMRVPYYILHNGFFPKEDFIGLPPYLGQIVHDIRYPIIPIFISVISLICNVPLFTFLFDIFLYTAITLYLFFGFYLYTTKEIQGKKVPVTIASILLIFALLVNYEFKPFLVNAPVGWFISLLIIYLLIKEKKDKKIIGIIIVFMTLNAITYFTPNLFVIMFISFMLVYRDFIKTKTKIYELLIIYLLIFLSYTLYISEWRFASIVSFFDDTFSLQFSFYSTVGAVPKDLYPLISHTSFANKVYVATIMLISLAPFFIYLFHISYRIIKRKYGFNKIDNFIPSTFVFGFVTYLAGSQRFVEWALIFTNIIFPKILPKNSKKLIYLVLPLFVCIIFSGYVYVHNENNAINYIKTHEATTTTWFSKNSDDLPLFTDFRTSAPFIVLGHYKTIGPYKYNQEMIYKIYYDFKDSSYLARITTPSGEEVSYFYVSTEMTKDLPGIRLYDWTIKGIPVKTYNAYLRDEKLNLIYSNGKSRMFYIP